MADALSPSNHQNNQYSRNHELDGLFGQETRMNDDLPLQLDRITPTFEHKKGT